MTPAEFDELGPRDFENAAVLDELRAALRQADTDRTARAVAEQAEQAALARLRATGEDYTAACSLIAQLAGRVRRTEPITDRDDELLRRARVFAR